MRFHTLAIHSHQEPEPTTGAVITPIYQTTTFAQDEAGEPKGYDYSRSGNPTRSVLEGVLADLENGRHGYCFASGLGALSTLALALFKPGDHLVLEADAYGGTLRFFNKVFSRFGVDVTYVDMTDLAQVQQAIRPETRMLYMETPTNPMLKLVDIAAIVALAKTHGGILTCVDNTFASPYLQRPLDIGADIVLHSTTKYIGGHSDVVGGALILKDDTHADAIKFHQNSIGATPDPFAAWLTLRGVKTLGLRMERHCQSALQLARFLESHPAVESVIYPGLASHPQHALASRQMSAFGGMISLRLQGGEAEARRFMKALKYFTLAESLGGVESLVESPALMTHKSVDPAVRAQNGLTDNLIRLSVGIEDVEDLQEDLDVALQAIRATGAAR